MRVFLTFAVLGSLSMASHAAPPDEAPSGLVAVRGKLLFEDSFSKPLDATVWPKGKGKWEVADGAVRVAELADDMHAAVKRHPLTVRNVVIRYEFKLDGAKATSLSLNAAKGHVCRVTITPTGFSVKKDKDKKTSDKAVVLDTCNVEIKPGVWHNMHVEIVGTEMLAQLDGKHIAYGTHKAIDVDLGSVGLTVSGQTASFKNLRVFEASANKAWPTIRAKLVSEGRIKANK